MSDEFERYVRMQMVGLFLSPVFYGMSVAIASGSIRAFFRQQTPHIDGSSPPGAGARTRLALLFYVVFIVGCASGALGQDVQWMKKCELQRLQSANWDSAHPGQQPDGGVDSVQSVIADLLVQVRIGGPALVLAVWAASIFLVGLMI